MPNPYGRKTHGMSSTPFYRVFCSILGRCKNKGCSNYAYYGGRGIKCLWKTFEEFYTDMYQSYLSHQSQFGRKDTTIDRLDNNGNYSKENCKWSTRIEQGGHKRNNNLITYQGKTQSISEWARETGITRGRLKDRIVKLKWPLDMAFSKQKFKNQFK